MTLEFPPAGQAGVVAQHVHGVAQRHPHLPASLMAQLVKPGDHGGSGDDGGGGDGGGDGSVIQCCILVTKLLVWSPGSYCSHKKTLYPTNFR